jgi:hypothetical protein
MSLIDKDSPSGEGSTGETTEEDSLLTIKDYRKEWVVCQEKGPHNMCLGFFVENLTKHKGGALPKQSTSLGH